METITLTVPGRPAKAYPIIVESNAIDRLPEIIRSMKTIDHIVILYDRALEGVAKRVQSVLPGSTLIGIPSGEASKSLSQVENIVQELLLLKATRQSLLINVGGGMLTDIGGFVASVFMRGIRCLHVSTSLLGMVDASIGGKTGVDTGNVKNMIGTMYHPEAVLVDIDVLGSLQDEQLREGLVEVIKMAATLDRDFFGWLEENIDRVMDRELQPLSTCIRNAVRMKAEVVERDDQDVEHRLLLNFGHTVGHAVEALSRFTISHGKAVSIGMVREMIMANSADRERIIALLSRLDMPMDIPLEMNANALWEIMENDKKSLNHTVRIAVPTTIGSGIVQTIEKTDFLAARHA